MSIIDALLVLAVLAVLLFWWQLGGASRSVPAEGADTAAIPPDQVPVLAPTAPPAETPTPVPTATPVVAEQVFLTHTVEPGETLLSIAGVYDVTVDEIRAVNNLSGDLLNVDQELTIPVLRSPQSAGQLISSEFTYTVKDGDTVISIATLFGSKVEEILAANGLTSDGIIRPGDVLAIPVRALPQAVLDSTTTAPAAPPAVPAAGPTSTIYIEPRLIGPPNRATLSREEPVLLRWVSVDVLAPTEWYVLLLYPTDGSAVAVPSIWTKATSYRLDTASAPEAGRSAGYNWQVSVVRVRADTAGGYVLEAASPPSLLRSFTWE